MTYIFVILPVCFLIWATWKVLQGLASILLTLCEEPYAGSAQYEIDLQQLLRNDPDSDEQRMLRWSREQRTMYNEAPSTTAWDHIPEKKGNQ